MLNDNINVKSGEDSNNKVSNKKALQIIYNSFEYKKFIERIGSIQDDLEKSSLPLDIRTKKTALLQKFIKEEQKFKENIFSVYETFAKINIDTERLRKAKERFDNGRFKEADAILKAEELLKDQALLLDAAKGESKETAENLTNLINNSNEFLIKAKLTASGYYVYDRFEKASSYFERSIISFKTVENLFEYAYFLAENDQVNNAIILFTEVLAISRDLLKISLQTYLPYIADALNNLGNLHLRNNDFNAAASSYQEALHIYKDLAKAKPHYLAKAANTLNNLGVLQQNNNDFSAAISSYQEALQTYRNLAKAKPHIYLFYTAETLNNLGNLQQTKNDFSAAVQSYQEALQIYKDLEKDNPNTYLYNAAANTAETLNNLSALYLKAEPDRDKSIEYAAETLNILHPFPYKTPAVQKHIETAKQLLLANKADMNKYL